MNIQKELSEDKYSCEELFSKIQQQKLVAFFQQDSGRKF